MNCRKCRARCFEYRDGTLSPRERTALAAHLDVCPRCRREYEGEAEVASGLQDSFKAATGSLSFDSGQAWLVRPKTSVPFSALANTNVPTGREQRVFRWLAAGAGTAILFAALVWGPFSRRERVPLVTNRPAGVHSDDLADPFSDWIEKRMIITIEDKTAGTAENFLTDRTGAIRKISVPRRD